RFAETVRARVGIGARQRKHRSPLAPLAADQALCNRRVNAVQHHAGFREPLLQVGDGGRVVIVEMRPGREDFDRLESVRCDVEEMLAAQPLTVVQMRRDPELAFSHRAKYSLYLAASIHHKGHQGLCPSCERSYRSSAMCSA